MTTTDLSRLTDSWQDLSAQLPFSVPIENDEQHARALAFLEPIWNEVGEDPNHPLGPLMQFLIELVQAYEIRNHPMSDATPAEMLAFLLEQRGVTQKQVEAGTGIPQGNLSKLLRGGRAFTAEHARKLGDYFRVNPGVFL